MKVFLDRVHQSEKDIQRATVDAIERTALFRALIINPGLKPFRGKWIVSQATAGVPDICVLAPGGRTIWFEVKTPIGRLNKAQVRTIEKIRKAGHPVYVVHFAREALGYLKAIADEWNLIDKVLDAMVAGVCKIKLKEAK